jgi:2-dehydropantoate 2-reductase
MRFVIVGAGAIGGVVGARLAQHGQDVVLVARGAHGVAIRERGLTLRTAAETVTLRLPVLASAVEVEWRPGGVTGDVVLLAVKGQDTAAALGQLAGCAPSDTPIVCLQNGVENERAALRLFPNVYAVPVLCPTGHLEPGVVEAYAFRTTGILDVGRYPTGSDDVARQISAAFASSGFVSQVRDDVMRWKWFKLIVNLANALEAVFGVGAVPDDLHRRSRQEGLDCLQAAGIDAASAQEDREHRGDLLELAPIGGGGRPGGSSWQSLVRGTGAIESDYLTGEIVLLGRLHGVPTPVNGLLQRLTRQAAGQHLQPGWLTPAEFGAMLQAESTPLPE